ncbi:hypothetical protein Tco_1160429, partial [Tanacetum coccineum]
DSSTSGEVGSSARARKASARKGGYVLTVSKERKMIKENQEEARSTTTQ